MKRAFMQALEGACILAVGLFGALLLAGFFGYLDNFFH